MKQIINLWVVFLFLVSILSSCGEKSKAGVNGNSDTIPVSSLSETNVVSSREVNNRSKTLKAEIDDIQQKISSLEKQVEEASRNKKWTYFVGALAVVGLIISGVVVFIWTPRMKRLNTVETEIASLKKIVKELKEVGVRESAGRSPSDRQRFDELERRLKKLEKERLPNVEVSKREDVLPPNVKKPASPKSGYFGTAASGGYFSELMNLKNEDARFAVTITGSEASFTPIMKLDDIKSLDWVERAVEFEGGVPLKDAVGMEVKEDGHAEQIASTGKWEIKKKVKIRLFK